MSEWWWAYLALGAFVGFLSGLLGIGGGSAMVPVLALIFAAKGFAVPYGVHLALGTSVATILFTASSSVLSHHRHAAVNWGLMRMLVPGVMAGTFAGALLAGALDARLLSVVFTALIYYAATLMLLERRPTAAGRAPAATLAPSAAAAGIGLLSSLTATGGASMVVAFLVRREVPVHEAIGTASGVSWALAAAGTTGYIAAGLGAGALPPWSIGFVYLPALAWIAAASMLTAPLGARLAHRTPARTLKRVFALVLYALATWMLVRFF
ncbi:MAG TPA: sulfite exporter TauE/SafE family protein [Burkholderiales bacterium]|nr:sulfite exporter TauE/SafE family protein [Burkholderiales bacterium]